MFNSVALCPSFGTKIQTSNGVPKSASMPTISLISKSPKKTTKTSKKTTKIAHLSISLIKKVPKKDLVNISKKSIVKSAMNPSN